MKSLDLHGTCTVAELMRQLEVSNETIRRDLKAMADKGLVERVHGGVVLPNLLREADFQKRLNRNAKEKRAIARLAAAQIRDGDSVMMDTGSTTAYVAHELASRRDLLLVTNSTEIARSIAKGTRNRALLTGGELRSDDGALFGAQAIRYVEQFRVLFAILSIGAVHLDDGLMDFHLEEAEFSRAVIGRAKRTILVADHSKFGRQAPVKVCDLDAIDTLITDRPPPPDFAERLTDCDVEVLVPAP